MSTGALAALVIRCFLVLLFMPFSALDKILGFDHAVTQAQEIFKPRALATLMLLTGLGIEIFCTLGVITGMADRMSALVLAIYCTATAVLYKRFWAQGDFWSNPDGKGRALFWDFLKNVSLGAGFVLIVIGADGSGLKPFLAAPMDSSHPYQSTR